MSKKTFNQSKKSNDVKKFDIKKEIIKYIVTFLILIIVFNLSMYLISLIPSENLYNKCDESAQIMLKEGKFINMGFLALSENGTDGLIINEAYSIDSNKPLESYVLMRKNYKPGVTKIQLEDQIGQLYTYSKNTIEDGNPVPDPEYSIAEELDGLLHDKVEISQTYTRYYHGYLLFFRPLLLIFNITQIRWFMISILVLLIAGFEFLLYKKLGLTYSIIYFAVLTSFAYFGLGLSLECAPLFVVLMISMIIMLLNIDKFDEKKMFYFLFIEGAIVNFIDFLTSPVLSMILPLSIYFLYNKEKYKNEDLKESLLRIIKMGLVWTLGYGLTWISKSIVVELVVPGLGISSLINQIFFRTTGQITELSERFRNMIWFGIQVVAIASIVTAIVLLIFDRLKIRKISSKVINENKNMILLSLVAFAWLTILFNHTVYHFDSFPYRNLIVPVITLFVLLIDEPKKKEEVVVIKEKIEKAKTTTQILKEDKNEKETLVKSVAKHIGAFLICVIVANVLLFLVCLIPSSAVEKTVKESATILKEEGPVPLVFDKLEVYNNNQTEAVIVNEIYSVDSSNPFESYIKARKNYKEGKTERILEESIGEGITANYNQEEGVEYVDDNYDSIGELNDFVEGNITTALNYGRYWHGYLVLYRPLMVLFNINQIKNIQGVVFSILIMWLTYLIAKKYGYYVAMIYFIALITMGYASVTRSLESAPVFLVMMISMLVFLIKNIKVENLSLFFLIVGICTNYMDYLTVPLLTIFMPLLLLMIDYSKKHTLLECIWFLVKSCIAWGFGYAGMWITKWAIYDLFISSETHMLSIGFSQSFYRMNRTNDHFWLDANIYDMILPIIIRGLKVIMIITMVIFCIEVFIKNDDTKKKAKKAEKKENKFTFMTAFNNNSSSLIFVLIALAPVAWYILLANHTFLHFFFTYRMLIIFVVGFSIFLGEAIAMFKNKLRSEK